MRADEPWEGRPSQSAMGRGRRGARNFLEAASSRGSRFFWATVGAFSVFSVTFALYVRTAADIDSAHAARLESYLLADELRQTSDDLTRFVRTYVATGNQHHKAHYQEILDVREGRKPRPMDAHNVYWDLVLEGDERPRPAGRTVPLMVLMREAGFTDAEFSKLAEAKAASDALTRTEYAAMALVESGKPNVAESRARATRMLNDSEYHRTKAQIMQPIADLHTMVEARTLDTVHAAQHRGELIRAVLVASGLALALFLWRLLHAAYSEQVIREDTDARYRTLFENAGAGLAEVAESGHVLNANREFCRIVGAARNHVLSQKFDYRTVLPLAPSSKAEARRTHKHKYTRRDGTSVWIEAHVHPVEGRPADGQTFIATAIDVSSAHRIDAELARYRADLEALVRERTGELTQRNEQLTAEMEARERAVTALHQSEDRLRFIAENTWDVIFILNVATGRFEYVSSSVHRQRGYTPEEVMSQPFGAALLPQSAARVRKLLAETVENWKNGKRLEILRLTDLEQPHREGHVIQTEVVATLHADADGNLGTVLGVTRDVTERKRTEDAIRRLAFHDGLTHLPNRRLLADRLEQTVVRARRELTRAAVLYLDLDGFKPVNDQFGHELGDWLLKAAAGRIAACLRETDTAARVGGDEFVALLANVQDSAAAVAVAHRIREALAAPFISDEGQRIQISSSIGIACFPDDADNESELVRKADQAMYRAKKAGRNTIQVQSKSIPPPPVPTESMPPGGALMRMIWHPSYASGNAAIDGEHRELLSMASGLLAAAMQPNSDTANLAQRFDKLLEHTARHFDHEESLLDELSYSRLDDHHEQHRELLTQARRLRERVHAREATIPELVDYFAVKLVRGHLLQEDVLFFPLVSAQPTATFVTANDGTRPPRRGSGTRATAVTN